MAIGATVVIISGGIDLSVGSIYALAGVTMALVLRDAGPMSGRARRCRRASSCALGVGLAVRAAERRARRRTARCIRSSSRSARCGCCAASRSSPRKAESILVPPSLTAVDEGVARAGRRTLSGADAGDAGCHRRRRDLSHAHGDGPAHLRVRRQPRGEPLRRSAAVAHPDRRVRGVRAHRRLRRVPRRELLRLDVVGRRAGLRAVRDRVGGRRRREPDRREGQRASARCSARCSSC